MGCSQSKESSVAHQNEDITKIPDVFRNTTIPKTSAISNWLTSCKIVEDTSTVVYGKDTFKVDYAAVSKRGVYPNAFHPVNQDEFFVTQTFPMGEKAGITTCVLDGHGEYGAECAQLALKTIRDVLASSKPQDNPVSTIKSAYLTANTKLHESKYRETGTDRFSGTTACAVCVHGQKLYCLNVGDSRAIACVKTGSEGLTAYELCSEQNCIRQDECNRIRACGGEIFTSTEKENGNREHSTNHISSDPPRVYHPGQSYPATAFSRSIGDSIAEVVGVTADAEVSECTVSSQLRYVIVASDGVWEFLNDEQVIQIVGSISDLTKAAVSIVVQSYQLWMSTENCCDDTTVVVLRFRSSPDSTEPFEIRKIE